MRNQPVSSNDALNVEDQDAARLWARIFTGAIQTRYEDKDNAATLWFNPVFDAGLIVQWRQDAGQWSIIKAVAVTGETLRREANPTNESLAWRQQSGVMSKAVTDLAHKTWQASLTPNWTEWLTSNQDNERLALSRSYAAERALKALRRSQGYDLSIEKARRALVFSDAEPTLFNNRLKSELTAFGESARLSLRPIHAFKRATGWSLVFQSAEVPKLIWLVHFNDKTNAEAVISSIEAVSIGSEIKSKITEKGDH